MKPKQMIPYLIGFFIPSYLILSADFELKRPPTGVMLCSQPASLFKALFSNGKQLPGVEALRRSGTASA
jgi:hypothetical protein